MPLIHHLARTGGTLISRCLGAMNGVCLLSEIHPCGVDRFNPLRQAANWYGLIDESEVRALELGSDVDFYAALKLIHTRASDRGLTFVVRDWSHLDWIGFPFTQPTMKSAWDGFSDMPDTGWLSNRCVTVRHPVDQYLSMRKLGSLAADWDDAVVWRGMRAFAEFAQKMTCFCYEDFLHCPTSVLPQICEALGMTYDDGWRSRWPSYHKITGDTPNGNRQSIAASKRSPVNRAFWNSLRQNDDFYTTLELLGYPIPEPLRRRWYGSAKPTALAAGSGDAENRSATPEASVYGSQDGSVKSDAIDWDEEVVRARQACEQSLDDAEPSLRLAQALVWIGQADEAADVLLKLTHVFDEAVSDDIGLLLRVFTATCDELDRAERKYDSIPIRRRWAQVDPIHQGNLFQLSLLLAGVGEIDESLAYCRRLLELDARHTGAAANFLLYTNYSDRYCTAEISNEHFRIGMRFTQPSDALPARPRMAAEKVRVGYLGSDFYTHPVGKIMLPLLQSHDRQRIEINVYHDGKKSDATTESIKKTVDYFTYVNGWSDERLIESVRMDELDVLIDLGGYTGGGNRLLALARRLAPVQASFLGYPHTSAIPAMDYRLTDRFADPPGLTDHLYGERLVWLEHAHLAWRPYDLAEKTLAVPCVQPLLGVFNNVAKISPSAIATYATILRRVPLASIVFKYGDRFGVSTLRDRYRQAFAAHGVPPHRLLFRTQTETLAEHLQTMANVDLALDSFPYQGTMTSLECLCVGTPIISCCGDYYAHRATSAMMIQMGLHELVADDVDEYVEIAVELLHDRGRLPGLRDEILDRFYASTLTDPRGLACELESIYKSWVG